MFQNKDIQLNFRKNTMGGTIGIFEAGGRSYTHFAFSGTLPLDYQEDAELYSALIENLFCDCVVLDIGRLTLTEETKPATLAFLLGLVLHCRGDVALVAGYHQENRRFLGGHFGMTAPIYGDIADLTRSAEPDSVQLPVLSGWSPTLACPQKFS